MARAAIGTAALKRIMHCADTYTVIHLCPQGKKYLFYDRFVHVHYIFVKRNLL
jgi:hypothetical protein